MNTDANRWGSQNRVSRAGRTGRMIRVGAALLALTLSADRAKAIVMDATAEDLAKALNIDSADIISVTIGESDTQGVAISNDKLGKFFPTRGGTFAILSTGKAKDAANDNNEGNLSTSLDGLDTSTGNDLVQLTLELKPPAGATCLMFNFAFYSEEFEEFVGSSFNDVFVAEIGESNFTEADNVVTAPNNFAFDNEGNPISINAVFGVSENTETTYDGGTECLTALTPVTGETVTITFSIMDLGDSIYDSAVFLDNFRWLFGGVCEPGATDQLDLDGDGVPDKNDNCPDTPNADQANSDADTIGDACDNCTGLKNPEQEDSDGDGIGDHCDNCPDKANPDQADTDGDFVGDVCDDCAEFLSEVRGDLDGDGVGDPCDNCQYQANSDQSDSDGDGVGEVCDNCPTTSNKTQVNGDGDHLGDACDNCPEETNVDQADGDGDGVGDACDNCPDVANADQADANGNGVGDACESILGFGGGDGANSASSLCGAINGVSLALLLVGLAMLRVRFTRA